MANSLILFSFFLNYLSFVYGNSEQTPRQLPSRPVAELNRSANGKKYTLSASTKAAFGQAQQASRKMLTVLDKTGFTQRGNHITLKTGSSKTVQLLSKPVAQYEEEGAELSYQGKLTYLHKYVFQVVYYESTACLLIDQTSGKIDTLQNIPTPSPTVQRVAAEFQGYPFEGASNGVSIYTVQAGRLKKEFSLETLKWIPYGLAWKDDKTILLKCLTTSEADKINSTAAQVALLKQNNKFFYLRVDIK